MSESWIATERTSTEDWSLRYEIISAVMLKNMINSQTRGGLDLLEYKIGSNHIIDRDLLADYLSLRIAKSNNALQKWVVVFALASTISTVLQVLRILNWIP